MRTRTGNSTSVFRLVGVVAAVAVLTAAQIPPNPLLDAAKRGDLATVRSLLQNRADPNVAQGDDVTALHIAAEQGHIEIAKLLVEAGANVQAKTRLEGYTPLHLAAGAANAEMVTFLLFVRADVDAVTTASGLTPLHLAAQALNGEASVRELLRRGAPVNARESSVGQTPLMLAIAAGRAASVRELLAGGADPALGTHLVDDPPRDKQPAPHP